MPVTIDNADAFFDLYRTMRMRLAPFRLKTDKETKKTVGIIEALLNRADAAHDGAASGSRFGVTAGHSVENYIARAENYLSALEVGKFPLAGLLSEPGMNFVDHSFCEKDGEMHVIFNRADIGYEWDKRFVDTFGHAVSSDMVSWRFEAPCLAPTGDSLENYQIWSPGVAAWKGKYYMAYTAVNRAVTQTIRFCVSDDLYHWRRLENAQDVKPGAWGRWSPESWSDCRDPQLFVDGDTVYLYYCTRVFAGENDAVGVPAMGIASSRDMLRWTDRGAYPPAFCGSALESPFMMKKDGKYYLFYTSCGEGTAYAVSDSPLEGFESRGLLIGKRGKAECDANVPSCAEVVCFKNEWYISCCDRLPGCEQYLELFRLDWSPDNAPELGERVMLKER